MTSNNYYAEISFDSLRFHYSSILDLLIQSNRRLNLYLRIASVNKNSAMSKVFMKKYKEFEKYHDMLIHNKVEMEK